MDRRTFLAAAAGSVAATPLLGADEAHADRTFATPAEAMKSPPEKLAYVVCTYAGTKVNKPDFLATVDVDPASKTYSQIVHRLPMPNVGDELHHSGWNACASCHGHRSRRHLILPGLVSGRIHVVDTQAPGQPKLHKVVEPEEIVRKTKLTAPHTVHCLADGRIMISMLGDDKLNGPGGFLLLDDKFEIVGRWEDDATGMKFNYDFWYQPRHNVMVSSEWAAPATSRPGFKLDDVKAGKYGQHLHFWSWSQKRIVRSIDLGEKGLVPLEVRFLHNPDSVDGYVGAALSSAIWHFTKGGRGWEARPVVQVDPVEKAGWPFPVPGFISDIIVSMDDRWLYFSNWLHGDIRQYDISNPEQPRLAGRLWLGGVIGNSPKIRGRQAAGGPQMLQLSLDGKRLYVTDSLFSSWDNQFYPNLATQGSLMLQIDVDSAKGGLKLNEKFMVDFGKEEGGACRAHEVRFPAGDSSSDVWG